MQFAKIIRKLMDNKGLTNYQLAKDLDIHPTTVANWLNGKEPRKKTLVQLANYFDVSVDFLAGRQAEEIKKPATISDDELNKINSIFSQLSPDNRAKLLELAYLYLDAQHNSKESR